MLITVEYVITLHPCARYPLKRLQEICGVGGLTPCALADREDIPVYDRIWTLIQVLRDWVGRDRMEEFVGWCVLRAHYHAASAYAAEWRVQLEHLVEMIEEAPQTVALFANNTKKPEFQIPQ